MKVLLRFRGKADHNIGRDLTIGNAFPQHFYFIEIFVECVFTVHFLQDTVGARLHGKMHEAAYLRVFGNGGDEIFGEIFGVARHKPESELTLVLADFPQQIGEIESAVRVVPVRVDVLPQQRDLLIPFVEQGSHFRNDMFGTAAAFPSAHIRHDAIGAEIIAAVHDIHPGVRVTGAERLVFFGNLPFLFPHVHDGFFAF